jgi:predicted methyltransferase
MMILRIRSGKAIPESATILFGLLAVAALTLDLRAGEPGAEPQHFVRITSKASLIHLGSLDSFDITTEGTQAAEWLYDALANQRPESARAALRIYQRIIPSENFGGEYTALEWLGEFLVAPQAEKEKMLAADRVGAAWYEHLAQNNFALLKDYLKQKYHLLEWKDRKTPKTEASFRFLEDFVLFNNPRRDRWERTSKTLAVLGLKKGDIVADIGCGPGYYSFRFGELVGKEGLVYAADNNRQHVQYVTGLAKKLGVTNVVGIEVLPSGIRLPQKVDMAYVCSLYHNIYALSSVEERKTFLDGIKALLKPGGRLIVIDNDLVEDQKLPYHGPYIARELIINQLWYHGFRLMETHQFIPQRYILVFTLQPGPEPPELQPGSRLPDDCIAIPGKTSLVRALKTTTWPAFTEDGRKLARRFLAALETKDPGKLQAVRDGYRALSQKERFGDEYTAFQWFCEYLLASPNQREEMLSDWAVREYFDRLAGDDFSPLKRYVHYKYFLDEVLDEEDAARTGRKKRDLISLDELQLPESSGFTLDQLNERGDFIAFNNPHREGWEKTSKILELLDLKQGMAVADVGCGPGYYTFKFSRLVGPKGRVYAVETVDKHLDYIKEVAKRHGVRNLGPILSRDNDTRLPLASVDVAFVCSLYHGLYLTSLEYVKDGFVTSIRRSLKRGGRLVIADNAILEGGADVPYYGPGISKELIITQLKHYGFRLVQSAQFIPQRYVLVFELE